METDKIFPGNWREVIQDKKVIFYNTGVGSLLHGREKRIEKMKWVFQIFKKHPGVVLWWRPHPLELSTLQSMLPELEKEYMEVRRQYRDESIGILDESTDLNRAIAISDAYYGSWSSVVELYRAVKKPVLTENSRIKSIQEGQFLPAALCIKEDALWFIQYNSNKLIKMDRNTFQVNKVVNIPGEPPFLNRWIYFYHIIDAGESLLLLLGGSRRIYEYEVDKDTIKIHKPSKKNFVFYSEIIMINDTQLSFFPYGSDCLLEYDFRKNTTVEKSLRQGKFRAEKCYELVGPKMYMTNREGNDLYQYDLENGSCITVKIGSEANQYWGVKKVGNCFVLPHMEKRAITIWNEENGEITELIDFPKNYACLEGWAYLDMFVQDGAVYIFPLSSNMIIKVDVQNKNITQAFADIFYDVDYNSDVENLGGEMYLCAKRYQECVYAYAAYRKSWDILNLESETIQDQKKIKAEKAEYREAIENIFDNGLYEESFVEGEKREICTLENYIKDIQKCDMERKDQHAGKNSIGVKIHSALIEDGEGE